VIEVDRHSCLGEALGEAFVRWPGRTCLIEADRERENERFTYDEFRTRMLGVASFLSQRGFRPGDRAAILMTNQSKWHLAAAAVLHLGGILVPLDFKLAPDEHAALLAHCRPKLLVIEHFLWRALSGRREQTGGRAGGRAGAGALAAELVVVTEAPEGEPLAAAQAAGAAVERWPEAASVGEPPALARRRREDVACIVYSSGTGGRPKGCLLTHENYLEQFRSLSELHPFGPGVRYLSILPTNHAIDFMVGFLGPYLCGATVVHLRTMRPEFVRDAFARYRITHAALVPMILKSLEAGIRRRIEERGPLARFLLERLAGANELLSRGRPNPRVARRLLPAVHGAFGGALRALFVGGAYTDPATLRFFHRLGIPVANGYGLTEAGTAITLDRLDPPRPETVGEPLPGVEIRIVNPDADGVGEIAVRGKTVMAGYLDDPELTRETIVDGWLLTGDLGRLDGGALRLLGRRKNMIVTAGGKNIYPEDVETAFEGIAAKEFCVFASHYLWPERAPGEERLVLAARLDGRTAAGRDELMREISRRNRALLDFQRVREILFWDSEFPRTASLKVKRAELAREIASRPYPEVVPVA
jgi:long-chain acyl-CoA synthetase